MRHLARRAQGRVIDFLEDRLGWKVVDATVREEKGRHDNPSVLRLEIHAEYEIDDPESDYRHDPEEGLR